MAGRTGSRRLVTGWITAAAAAVLAVCGAGTALAAPASGRPARARVTAAPPADILAAPTRVARTTAGDVGYREVGTGSPLLLITGFSATMDDWAPSFADALAAHHRVVVFDNAGVGATAALPGPARARRCPSRLPRRPRRPVPIRPWCCPSSSRRTRRPPPGPTWRKSCSIPAPTPCLPR